MADPPDLTHLDSQGRARMVDVSAKARTARRALAAGTVRMAPATLSALQAGSTPKGDVLAAARIAGMLAAKRTPELIPLAHPVALSTVEVRFQVSSPGELTIQAEARATDRTGVEMEALVAVCAAGLTVYDMCKSLDRGMVLTDVRLLEKEGGRSGRWQREPEP